MSPHGWALLVVFAKVCPPGINGIYRRNFSEKS